MSDDSRELIRLAFEKAKESGRPNWYGMDVGVLKNRMLDLTNHDFRESDYGAPTFMEFVRSHSDVLELDETRWPPAVTLKGVNQESESTSASVRTQVRLDLWQAVMDFSGGARYVWDNDERAARPASDSAADGPAMPTITVELFTKWKKAFADGVDDAEQDARFKDWVEHLRPANFLAARVRYRWNDYLKKEVENHLIAWFQRQKLPLPVDLSETRHGAVRGRDDELRRRLIACVRFDDNERVGESSNSIIGPSSNEVVNFMDHEIWFVFPNTGRAQTAGIRDDLRRECRKRALGLQEKRRHRDACRWAAAAISVR